MAEGRKSANWQMMAVFLALAINLGGGIWWSSRIQATVENLTEAVSDLKVFAKEATYSVTSNTAKTQILEVRLQAIEQRLSILEHDLKRHMNGS